MDRKKKLEAGLEGLFSTFKKPKEQTRPQRPATPDAGASLPKPTAKHANEYVKPAPSGVEQPKTVSSGSERPTAATPTAKVKKIATQNQTIMPSPQSLTQSSMPGTPVSAKEHKKQLVVFTLANEYYGLDIAAVENIIKLPPITAVPGTDPFIKGVINLRGAVLPVADLRKRFGLSQEAATKDTRIVVVEVNGAKVGIVVDSVTEVLYVPTGAVEPPPFVTRADQTFITGIAKVDKRLIILLNMDRVFSLEDQADLQTLRKNQCEELRRGAREQGSSGA